LKIQETIDLIAKSDPEKGLKLYIEASAFADRSVTTTTEVVDDGTDMAGISYELLRLAMTLYEDRITDVKSQCRCITAFSGTILALKSVSKENYESLITRTAQFAAKIASKPEQCQLVALCAHLFYPADNGGQSKYSNPQRALECLQRSLKLADACTTVDPACVTLFVELLEHYLYFFEKKNPLITHAYISGLIALINEHLNSLNAIGNDKEAKAHFIEVIRTIKKKKMDSSEVSEMFSHIQIS
jgi:vacuolar protein sorting-associated protein 35